MNAPTAAAPPPLPEPYRLDPRAPLALRVGVVLAAADAAGLADLLNRAREVLTALAGSAPARVLHGTLPPVLQVIAAVPADAEAGLVAAAGELPVTFVGAGTGPAGGARLDPGPEAAGTEGEIVADHADLLVLDHDASGLPARAGRRGVPVVRLDRREPIDAEALGRHLLPGLPEAARARLRDYAGERALRAGAEAPDFCWAGPIRHAPRLGWYAGLYPRLRDRLVPPAAVAANARLPAAGTAAPLPAAAVAAPALHRLYAAHLRADRLALHYANLHRATVVLVILLGALALILAASSLAFAGAALAWAELLTLATVFGLVVAERYQGWHTRWLDYRLLAELLRPMPYLAMVGRNVLPAFARARSAEAAAAATGGHAPEGRLAQLGRAMWPFKGHRGEGAVVWVFAQLAAVVRHAGIVPARHDAGYLEAARRAILANIVTDQRRYHDVTAFRAGRIEAMLAGAGAVFFVATVLVLLAETFGHVLLAERFERAPPAVHAFLTWLTAVFPTLSAAAFAIRAQLELEILRRRSLTMELRLRALGERLAGMAGRAQARELVRVLVEAAEHMAHDAADWAELLEPKEAEAG